MATREQIEQALVNADKAGDTEAARALAQALKAMGRPAQRTTAQNIGRQLGLTARYALEGGLALPSMVGDALGLKSSQAVSTLGDQLGLPRPEGGLEEGVGNVTRAMSGAGSVVGIGKTLAGAAGPVVSSIGELLSAGPGTQIISGATSSGARELAEASGAGPVGQTAAALAGGLAVPAAQYAGSATVRGLIRGGEQSRQVMAERLGAARNAGAEPTVGMATGARAAQATEAGLSKVPGGAGRMASVGPKMAEGIGKRVDDLADDLSISRDPTLAGSAIERGIKSFVNTFKGKQRALYDQLDNYVAADSPVDVTATSAALKRLTEPIQGAEKSSAILRDPTLARLAQALDDDAAATGAIPYRALKELRTMIGNKLSDGALVSDTPRAQLKQVYGALTDDMERAAKAAGPDAEKALARANRYTRAGLSRIEERLEKIIKPEAERTYKTLVNDPGDASKIGAVLKSLPKQDRDVVRATFIERMGKALPGKQDEAGEIFSTETFLTNWNKLDPRSKRVLFADGSGGLRKDLDAIAKTAAMVREQSKVLANPSGTAAAIANYTGGGAVALSALSGNFGTAATLLGAMTMANGAARLMTHAPFVNWLARSTEVNGAALPAVVNSLAQYARLERDPDIAGALGEVLSIVRQQTGSTAAPAATQ